MHDDSLIFLHISDIHFNHSKTIGEFDIDEDLRKSLEQDVVRVVSKSLGKIDGILITGDISFSGKEEELELRLNGWTNYRRN